jgi:ketosteroid isomerase-like protein
MSQENVEIVRRYYSAWNAGGIDAARAFWSEEIEWHDAPDMPQRRLSRRRERRRTLP